MAFEIFQGSTGKYYFRLKATNGQIILASEAYEAKASAQNGIQSVINNTKDGDGQFERKESKNGDPYFVLKAKNGEIIGKSEMYSSKDAMENGIQSVMKNAQAGGDIKDLT
jgi:hypothetical protein